MHASLPLLLRKPAVSKPDSVCIRNELIRIADPPYPLQMSRLQKGILLAIRNLRDSSGSICIPLFIRIC